MATATNKISQVEKKETDRLKILERIDEFERNQWWSKDVEDDRLLFF